MYKIELTSDQEAQVLVNLINVAVKTLGLEAAESGLYFVKKIKEGKTPDVKTEDQV